MGMTGWLGMKGARCAFTPIGPMPGPPPPCGMQNVLCRFKWQTSAPMWPGDVRPTCSGHAQQLSCHSRDQEPHDCTLPPDQGGGSWTASCCAVRGPAQQCSCSAEASNTRCKPAHPAQS